MAKRLVSLFLTLIMVVGVLPCTVFAVEPSAVIAEVDSATNTTLPQDGAYKLTIVNDSYAPAKYTVSIKQMSNATVSDLINLAPKTKMTVAKINDGDTYSVDVEYPEYYAKKSDVACVFSSDGKSLETVGGEKWTHTVGATASTLQTKIYRATDSDGNPPKEIGTTLEADTDVSHYSTGDALWKTAVQWTVSFATIDPSGAKIKALAFAPAFGKKDATNFSKSNTAGEMDELFLSEGAYSRCYSYAVGTTPKAQYSLEPNNGKYTFTSNPGKSFVDLTDPEKLERANEVFKIFEEDIKAAIKKNQTKNWDYFTYDASQLKIKVNSSGAIAFDKKLLYTYQLVKQTGEEVKCNAADITLTYTIPTTMIATQTALDVVNADRFTAIHENLDTEWLGKVLDKLKEKGYTSADLKDRPERIIEVVGLDTLTAVFGAETMPKPDSITLAEVEENNDFYQGNTYTLTAASDSNLIKPLYAELQLPEFVLQALTKDNISAILNLAVISPKGSKISEYEKEQTELNNSTTKLLNEDTELNLASNSTWKSNVKSKTDGFNSFVNTEIGKAKAAYNKIKASASDLSMALAQIIKELNGTKLPIQLGYTFNFGGVQPGRYKVTFDGMASWSDLTTDRIITVNADGTVDYGQEPQDMVTLDFVADETVWNKFCDQLIGDNFDHDALGALIKILLFGKDKDGKNTVAPALFTSNGVWLGTEGGPGSMAFGTNTIEFTAVEADGVTPLKGATYMLINRDQLMQLMQTMIGLGKDAVEAVNGVSFDELMETYQVMLQAGDIKSLAGDLSAKLGQFVPALLDTVMKLDNFSALDLPLIFEATSDENGLVRFGATEENTIKGVMELGGLTMNTAQDVTGNVVGIINDDIIGTIITQLKDVKSRVGEINVSYKAALERVDAVKKSVNNTVSSIRNDINTMKNTVSGFFTNVRNWLKSFFGIVTRADAIEFNTSTIQTVNTLLDKLSADKEVIDMIVDLLGKAGTIMGITNDLSTLDSSLNTIKSKEADWDKYVNKDGWKSSKPGEPKPPMNKLEEFMDQLEKKIKELNDTAKSVKETAGKLDRPTEILNYLGKQGDDLYDVAYGLLDLLGVAIEGDDRFPDGNYILMQIAAPVGYTRSNVCYTLHVENGQTTAQRGILTPLLETNSKALEAYVASLSDVNKAKLERFQKDADSYLDRQAKLWDAMNYFSMTRVIANGVRDSIIADVAEAVFKAMPGCFVDVDAVELEIRTALKQVDSNPTFDELLKIADKMITKNTATVGRGWTVIAAVNVPTVEQIPA